MKNIMKKPPPPAEDYNFIRPDHYKKGSKEVWEMMRDIWGQEAFITFCEINAFKYRLRLGSKPDQPIERDLKKAQWYEEKAAELRAELIKEDPPREDRQEKIEHLENPRISIGITQKAEIYFNSRNPFIPGDKLELSKADIIELMRDFALYNYCN